VVIPPPDQVVFDANGRPTLPTLNLGLTLDDGAGADPNVNVALDLAAVTQQAAPVSLALASQNGVPPGTLTGIAFERGGSVSGVYSNGLRNSLGQLPTAVFANPGGLEARGNNLYQIGANSGAAIYGLPGSDGRGTIAGGQLENSNVNLAQEFADLIVTQRGFQASSRVVSAADELLQELINTAR
jgi:flagellar hook protein FlgE